MLRKICLIALVLALSTVLTTAVFADTTTKSNTANAIEILSPKIGTEGVIVLKKDTLYVNIRLKDDVLVYMSLAKIDPAFYLGDDPELDVTVAPVGDFSEMTEAEKTDLRKVIFERYNKALATMKSTKANLDSVVALVNAEFGDAAKMEALRAAGGMTPAQLQLSDRYRWVNGEYQKAKKAFATVNAQYDKLFARRIMGPTPVEASAILPYFKTEIEGVVPGTYQLIFSEKADGSAVVKVLEFTVTTSEETVEMMIDTLPENMNRIWTVPGQ